MTSGASGREWAPQYLVPVAVGGGAGALARQMLVLLWTPSSTAWWATMAVNVLGCALIGILAAYVASRAHREWLYALVGTGFLGGFTTVSSYAAHVVGNGIAGRWLSAGVLLVLTPALCFGAAAVTSMLAERRFGVLTAPEPDPLDPCRHGGWYRAE